MTKTIAITAIVLVAVVMGLSTLAPAIPQAEAEHGGRTPSPEACEKLIILSFTIRGPLPEQLQKLIAHC